MAFLIEVIVHLSVDRAELLQRLPTSESLHRSFSSPKWLMRILRPIVAAMANLVAVADADLPHRTGMGQESVGHDLKWATMSLHDPLEEPQGRDLVSGGRDYSVQNLAFMINGAP
jgi:hypothetical protein